jgi:hypothetical protein
MIPSPQLERRPAAGRSIAAAGAVIAAVFLLVYARSLTFVYVEGDDATSIAYHALGRIRDVQPPYSAYQCMMDAILRLLPPQEHLLRVTAMLLTGIAAPVLIFLIVLLAYEWAGEAIRIARPLAAFVVLLAAPELLYLGMVYTPALVALAAAIGAQLMARRAARGATGIAIAGTPWFWASVVLFGAGSACRWDVLAYGAIVASDLWLGPGLLEAPRRRRFVATVVWGLAAFGSWLTQITLIGYGPSVVLKTLRTAGPVESFPGLEVTAANMQPLVTPALLLTAVVGFAVLAKRRNPAALLVLLGVVLTARYLPLGIPKWFLLAVPGILTCALAGFSKLWRARTAPVLLRAALMACLVAPWLFGVHTVSGDSAYGPGFERRPYDRPSTSIRIFRVVPDAGALVPTSEGPRPLGGHAYVLLGGGWRRILQQSAQELNADVQLAAAGGLPILQDLGQGYVVAALASAGFRTLDSWKLDVRTFVSADGATRVRVIRPRYRENLFTPAGLQHIEDLAGSSRMVAFAYSSTLRRIYNRAPDSLEQNGPSVVLDLQKLRAATPDKIAVDAFERLP